MKYLSHYIELAQTKLFEKYGAFFAFSKAQFDREKKEGVQYTAITGGLLCPSEHVTQLLVKLDGIRKAGIAADVAENGIIDCIKRELGNHECQITMDTSDAKDSLAGYDYTDDQFKQAWNEFWQYCVDNDYF